MKGRALVTGASRGIGKAIALKLANDGFDVAIGARTLNADSPTLDHSMSVHRRNDRPLPGSLEETAELIGQTGREAFPVRMDLTDPGSVEEAVDLVLRQWGSVDLVVNNGRHIGPGLMDTILDTPLEQYRLFVEAHAVAPIRIAQLVLPGMLSKGAGTFVTISSGSGTDFYPQGKPGAGGAGLGYRLGKSAGHTLVGSLLAEYADQGIRAFNVDPGLVSTERNSIELAELGFDPDMGAPPAAIGAAVAWLVTVSEADELMRGDISGQDLAREKSLYYW
ncbi:SDR family NAD(P)-dependent oxidoreductase [Nocardiopsis oceani]